MPRCRHRARKGATVPFAIAMLAVACTGEPTREAGGDRASASDAAREDGDGGAQPSPPSGWVVDFASFGPIPLGVSLDEANAAAAGAIEVPAGLEDCGFATVRGAHEGVSLMVVNGMVARVDVRHGPVPTERGAAIGTDAARILALYPEGVEQRARSFTSGGFLTVTPASGEPYRIVFETSGTTVVRYRAGVLPEVTWSEGCA